MPRIQKVIDVGTSKAVTIPSEWLEYYKRKGKIINEVVVHTNGNLIIEPILEDIESD